MSAKIEKFEDLKVWNESMNLSMQIYQELKECSDFGLKDQIQRASVSVPSNIAEGFERNSNKEFIRFLYISKGSAGELRTQLYICKELGLIENKRCDELIDQSRKISAILYNLIKTREINFS